MTGCLRRAYSLFAGFRVDALDRRVRGTADIDRIVRANGEVVERRFQRSDNSPRTGNRMNSPQAAAGPVNGPDIAV